MAHPCKSWSTVGIFLNFAQWKGQQLDESDNNGLYKKMCSEQMDHFGSKMAHPHNSGSALKFLLNLQNESG